MNQKLGVALVPVGDVYLVACIIVCYKRYIQSGGQFIETTEATRRAGMEKKKVDAKKRKHLEEKKETKDKGKK
jgi:hypothetical protein